MCVGNGPSRIMPRLNRRLTPSGFMMKGITSPGLAVGAMSGTSLPSHFSPVHWMIGRSGSQGWPFRSAEARLYSVRRFSGQLHAHLGCTPMPEGSALSRRAMLFPSSLKLPE